MKKVTPVTWFGSKVTILDWLYDLFPRPNEGIDHFVDLFGGGGSVSMNLPYKYKIVTYNDIYNEVTNFFHVLRNHEDELIRQLRYTCYSRNEYAKAVKRLPGRSDIERAREFFIRCRQGFAGCESHKTRGSFAICKDTNGAGLIGAFQSAVEQLPKAAALLRNMQIENQDAMWMIKMHGMPTTLLYADPPYLAETRSTGNGKASDYTHDAGDEGFHRKLAKALTECKAKVIVSGYPSELYKEIYSGWHVEESDPVFKRSKSEFATEVCWMNFKPNKAQMSLL